MQFELKKKDAQSKARAGVITTDHGTIETPIFMPVGTVGTVKGVHQTELKNEINPDIILGNTYHLYLRPQTTILEQAGGLHKFMNWDKPILTDSGGFQVMSLSKLNRVDREKGAIFNSHVDGKKFILSPEESIRIQKGLDSDIVMIMDECPKKTTSTLLDLGWTIPPNAPPPRVWKISERIIVLFVYCF